jgi:phage gpG-like protein
MASKENNNGDVVKKQITQLEKELDKLIPRLSKISLNFYWEAFEKQGFTDDGLKLWVKRKREYTWPILKKTGTLKGSLLSIRTGSLSWQISTDVSYAPYHNYGTDRLPQRQFIGESKVLNGIIAKEIDKIILKIFR